MSDKDNSELIEAFNGILSLLDAMTDQHEDGFTHYMYDGSAIDYDLLTKQKLVLVGHIAFLEAKDAGIFNCPGCGCRIFVDKEYRAGSCCDNYLQTIK